MIQKQIDFLSMVSSTRKVGVGLLVLTLMVCLGWERSVGRDAGDP